MSVFYTQLSFDFFFFSNKLTSFRLLKRKQTQLSIGKSVKVTNNLMIQFTEIGLLMSRKSTINRSKNSTSFKAIYFLFWSSKFKFCKNTSQFFFCFLTFIDFFLTVCWLFLIIIRIAHFSSNREVFMSL